MSKTVLNPAEAAEYLGVVSVKTLADWRYKARKGEPNRGPKFVKVGGKVGYPRVGLDRFLLINETDSDAKGKKTK